AAVAGVRGDGAIAECPRPAGARRHTIRRDASAASREASRDAAERASITDGQRDVAHTGATTGPRDGDGCAASRTLARGGAEARIFDDDDQKNGQTGTSFFSGKDGRSLDHTIRRWNGGVGRGRSEAVAVV